MNDEHHPAEAGADQELGDLDPIEATALLEGTRRRAQRQFDVRPPLVTAIGAAVLLVAYGTVWLSVRRQQPYEGPSLAALAVLYAVVLIWVAAVAIVHRRATSGISGRSSRQRWIKGVAFATIWIAVYVFDGALYRAGAGHAIVYGIYPAAAPLIIVGSAVAADAAAGEKRLDLGFATAAVAVGAAGSLAGPAGSWGLIGAGVSSLAFGYAAVQVRQRRA